MRHQFIRNFIMGTLIGFSTIANAQNSKTMNNTSEEKKVLQAIEKMTIAFESKDIDAVMACYEKNATIVFEPEKPVSDSTQLRMMFEEMSKLNPKFTYSGHEVFIAGDIATHIAPWQMTATAPDGTTIQQSGLSVAILRKQANGQWLMVIDNPHGQFLMKK